MPANRHVARPARAQARKRWSWRPALAAVAVALLAGGCMRLIVSQLDTLVVWQIEGYVDLDRAQERMVRDEVARTLAWFRTEELPEWLALLGMAADDVERGVTMDLLEDRYARVERLGQRLQDRLLPGLAALAASLSDEQVEDLFRELAKENEELRERYAAADKRLAARERATFRALRRFFGRLDEGQTALVRAHLAGLHDTGPERLKQREAWQRAFRATLAGRHEPGFSERLGALLREPARFGSPDYQRLTEENRVRAFTMTTELVAGLTTGQRAHFRRRTEGFARDLRSLANGRLAAAVPAS